MHAIVQLCVSWKQMVLFYHLTIAVTIYVYVIYVYYIPLR